MAEHEPSSRTIVIVGQGGVQTDLDLDTLGEEEVADVIPDLLTDYSAECKDWTLVASEHWRCQRWARAEDLLQRGISFFAKAHHMDHMALVNLHAMLAHLYLAQSRLAPRTFIPNAKYDILPKGVRTKDHFYTEATAQLNHAEDAMRGAGTTPEDEPASVAMGKIVLYLARGQPATAQPLVDRLLRRQPNNVAALLARARLQFARRQHEPALLTYQKILTLAPHMKPDPRIGLGLCAYSLGDKKRAREAWERALVLDPEAWVPRLLIGLMAFNLAREPSIQLEERIAHETEGVDKVSAAFRINPKSAAAALALAAVATLARNTPVASKLAERAVQYSDNKRHTVLANSERGRLGFIAGDVADAGPYIAAAKSEEPNGVNMMAELTLAQVAIKNGNLREALNFVEQTAKRLNGKGPLEFTVLHASLLAYPHMGMPADELERNRKTARNMFSEIQNLVLAAHTQEDFAKLRGVANDADVFVELAKLWQEESIDKAITSYRTAIQIKTDMDSSDGLADTQAESQDRKPIDYASVRLSINLAALYALQGETDDAEGLFQDALQRITTGDGKEADVLKAVLAYNLGRASEQGGDRAKASQWYRDVLGQHPEHMESKVRLALIAAKAKRFGEANKLLKECLEADSNNLALRSAYTTLLIAMGLIKEALSFTVDTNKRDRNDVFTLTALGWLHFTLGREAKSPQEVAEKSKQFLRSAEAYERALINDPQNAVAAQGLAIALAEDTLITKAQQSAHGVDELKNRTRLASQALSVFGRIKDSLPEPSVNVNIGHCYFNRGEEERAIEAYGAALNLSQGQNVPVLLYLCRAWFSYATKETNFSAMGQALNYAQRAMHVHPNDRAILYNIAMIQQKAAEIMLGLDPSRRTLDELKLALKRAQEAVSIFRALADDKSKPLLYDPEVADHRARYGESLVRKGPDAITEQEEFESAAAARVEEARRIRAEEQARIEAAQAARQAEIEARAAEIAEKRRQARDEARAFQEQLSAQREEEEQRRLERAEQRKRRKDRTEDGDIVEDGEGRPKKSRRKQSKKKKRRDSDDEDDDLDLGESAPISGADDDEDDEGGQARRAKATLAALRAKKAKGKLTRHEDPDDDEDGGGGRRGKQYKSKAIIEDSDEDDDDVPADTPRDDEDDEAMDNGAPSPLAAADDDDDDE